MEKDGMGEQTLPEHPGRHEPARLSWPEGRSGAPGFLAILVFSFSIIAGPAALVDTPLYNICRDKPCPTADKVRPGLQPFMEAAGDYPRQVAAGVIYRVASVFLV